MKIKLLLGLVLLSFRIAQAQPEKLIYHEIQTDATGKIIPWYSKEPGKAYSHVIQSVWHFWDTMRTDLNGLPYYMNHQVWQPDVNDPRGLGGDQIQMALSSWRLLYAYTGEKRIRENMKFMADYYISHGFSSSECEWPDIPFPYNTLVYSGIYDGDMVTGKNYTQPDKAGSLGIELVLLFKMMNRERYPNITDKLYLDAAIEIANTLAKKTKEGDENNSPLPFKVNAITGEPGQLFIDTHNGRDTVLSIYTSNWSGTMELFLELIKLNKGEVTLYQQAFDKILAWMKKYPLKNNKWGPFFEDVPGWSDTQINAITFAQFMMNHKEYFPDWKTEVNGIFNWVYTIVGNKKWQKYGVIVVNEQTAYQTPGNSHTSRQASAELQYVTLTGDTSRKQNAIRQLNWATYMVDFDGKNRYPQDDNWLTDGYGDYVRHYLRAMAALPELSASDEEHILSSSSVIQQADYKNQMEENFVPGNLNSDYKNIKLRYATYDKTGTEQIHLLKKPTQVLAGHKTINEMDNLTNEGYKWEPLRNGGILTINRTNANEVTIIE
jgi:hypothetical protein